MKDRQRNLAAGVVAVLTLAVATVVLFWFGRDAGWFGGGAYAIAARFDRAPGVRPGTPVTVGGISVGRVRRVNFVDPASLAGGVVAEIALDRGHLLRRGAAARVMSAGVGSGRMTIELDPGPTGEPALESGAAIRGDASGAAASILPPDLVWTLERSADKLSAAADALTPLLTDAQRIVEPRSPSAVDVAGTAGNLSSAIARLDAAARGLNDVFGDEKTRGKLREGIDNLHTTSVESRKLIGDASAFFALAKTAAGHSDELIAETRAAVAKTSQRIEETTGKLNHDLDVLGGILTHLDPVAAKIGRGEGTLGRMAADDKLYETLLLSLRRMGEK
jgi:phospholipid/cholesterol/gamma-HCH transport system substrate-binding protein